jgi:hypothetical protein
MRSSGIKADQPVAITPIEYGGLQEAYDHFNAALFDSALPEILASGNNSRSPMSSFAWPRSNAEMRDQRRHYE